MKRDRRPQGLDAGQTDEPEGAVRRFLAGDAGAFDEIVAEHERLVYNLAYRMLGDPEEARDAAQEIFLRVYESLRTYRFEARFSTWLYRLAVNALLNYRRRWWRLPVEQVEDAMTRMRDALVATEASPDEQLLDRERVELIRRAMAKLPRTLRAPLVLRDLEGLSYREISSVLSVNEGTVASRLNEARKQLARRLQRMYGPHGGREKK